MFNPCPPTGWKVWNESPTNTTFLKLKIGRRKDRETGKILISLLIWSNLKLLGSIVDKLSNKKLLLEFNLSIDLDEDICSLDTIGWVVKHSDLMNVFFDEVDNVDNIFFKSSLDLSFDDIKFDYEFVSTGANSNHKKNRNFIDIRKSYNQSCLTFEVLVRGNVHYP